MSNIENNKFNVIHGLIAAGMLLAVSSAQAGVSAADAAKLKSELTPMGAEKAGNKDGSIPGWDGGFKGNAGGKGGRRTDPYANEKPVVTIDVSNADKYADKLTDGTMALLKKYPDEFKVNVYPTHRTALAPQWVYDNTLKNATNGRWENGVPKGVYGGIPFPIPKTGEEVMTNHQMRWSGESWDYYGNTWYQITKDGKAVLISDTIGNQQFPYYYKDGNVEEFEKGDGWTWLVRTRTTAPALRAGEALLAKVNVDTKKLATWVYLTGQRRTRLLPNACCDAPTPAAAGVMSFDELYVWQGQLDRFDWKLVGKKEMFIPYNTNGLMVPPKDETVIGKHGYNPDYMRWELHRVWVVEANLKPGQRHSAAKSRYYCDEDTWICVLADRWDAKGQLWKTLWMATFIAPDIPAVVGGSNGLFDLLSGTAFVGQLFNSNNAQLPQKPRRPESFFTDAALSADSAR